MADTISLSDFADALTFAASIDGETQSSGRHPLASWLYPLINRGYRSLRSKVTAFGGDEFRVEGSATTIPAAEAGEDFIELAWPAATAEVVGVDVLVNDRWSDLKAVSWANRRQPRALGVCWPHPGWWAIRDMPQPATTSTAGGGIVIWPQNLSGSYKLWTIPNWVPLTDGSHVLLLYPSWEEWLLQWCTIRVAMRDNDKASLVASARIALKEAEAELLAQTRRKRRGNVQRRKADWPQM